MTTARFSLSYLPMKKILIADHLFIIRAGLSRIANTLTDTTVAGEAGDIDKVTALLRGETFDLLVLDPQLEGFQLQMISQLKMRYPALAILVYSEQAASLFAKNYFNGGADGYLEKKALEDEIRQALGTVLQGGKYAHYLVRQQFLGQKGNVTDELSTREKEVARMICQGAAVNVIAAELQIKPATVSTYKTRIFEKLGINNVIELVKIAEQHALI